MKKKLNTSYLQGLVKKTANKGFTLTELLVVIVITGVMPAIVMPFLLNHYDLRQQQNIIYYRN